MKASKKYFAEAIGTFVLVLMGCGSAVIAGDKIGFLGISFAFGLSVVAMAYAIGPISGCHINPAISIAMCIAKKLNTKDAVYYVISQCLGAVVASLVLLMIAKGHSGYDPAVNGLGQNGYDAHSPMGYSLGSCFLAEVVLTAIFLLVIFGATAKAAAQPFAGLVIGLSLVLIHLIGIPISGTSVNPARSFGPAVILGGEALNQLWLFWVAPILGGIISALLWTNVFEKE